MSPRHPIHQQISQERELLSCHAGLGQGMQRQHTRTPQQVLLYESYVGHLPEIDEPHARMLWDCCM